MSRIGEIKKYLHSHLQAAAPGLEIAPWHSPLLPKNEFPSVLSLDVFPHAELLQRARAAQPAMTAAQIAAIEPPDFVGNAADLAAAIPAEFKGKLKFIVSSHNLEHIPNPIKFLIDCTAFLADDGVLVMAIPDKRACFDHWRPLSSLGQLIEAYLAGHLQPSVAQLIDHNLGRAYVTLPTGPATVFAVDTAEDQIYSDDSRFEIVAHQLHEQTLQPKQEEGYVSAHCWTFTPESFALLLRDLVALRLLALYPREISASTGGEFFVHLCKMEKPYPSRTLLCRQVMAAQGRIVASAKTDPRRYRRLYSAYTTLLRGLDWLRLKSIGG